MTLLGWLLVLAALGCGYALGLRVNIFDEHIPPRSEDWVRQERAYFKERTFVYEREIRNLQRGMKRLQKKLARKSAETQGVSDAPSSG